MSAGHGETNGGKTDFGFLAFEEIGDHVRLDMVDPEKRFFQRFGKRFRDGLTDQKRSDEPGVRRAGHGIDFIKRDAGFRKRVLQGSKGVVRVQARGDLGYDARSLGMLRDLRNRHERQKSRIAEYGYGSVVAGGFEREDEHGKGVDEDCWRGRVFPIG